MPSLQNSVSISDFFSTFSRLLSLSLQHSGPLFKISAHRFRLILTLLSTFNLFRLQFTQHATPYISFSSSYQHSGSFTSCLLNAWLSPILPSSSPGFSLSSRPSPVRSSTVRTSTIQLSPIISIHARPSVSLLNLLQLHQSRSHTLKIKIRVSSEADAVIATP